MLAKKSRGGHSLFLNRPTGVKKITNPFFVVEMFRTNSSTPQFAVVVSKKNTKTAPARNLIKRRIYSILELEQNKIKPNLGLVVIIRKAALTADFNTIKDSITNTLAAIGAYN